MAVPRVLVIENDSSDDICRLGAWLMMVDIELDIVRPHAGDPLPAVLGDHGGLIVLGGDQHAYNAPDGTPGAPWFPATKDLLRAAVNDRVPTLGICLGGQLLAEAFGGRVERGESPEIGARLIAKRDIASSDPLFGPVPFTPDVYQWHFDEITLLPPGAVLLATSIRAANQAFRIGDRCWGTQFHIECDAEMLTTWVEHDHDQLTELGLDATEVLEKATAVLKDVEEVWRPFTERFAALVKGTQGSMPLPVIQA